MAVCNDVEAAKKADVFLSVLGATEYGLLKNLITPQKGSDASFQSLPVSAF